MAVSIATAIIYDNGWKYELLTTETKGGPGQEVTPGDEVEEEEVHHHPANNESQDYQQPERPAQPPLDLLTEFRPPLQQISASASMWSESPCGPELRAPRGQQSSPGQWRADQTVLEFPPRPRESPVSRSRMMSWRRPPHWRRMSW